MKGTLQTIPAKLPTDSEAETILKDVEPLVARTPTERDAFEWAFWPTLALAEEQQLEELAPGSGQALRHYLLDDMVYRLSEMLPDMAEDTEGTPEERSAKATARAGVRVAERITELLAKEPK